MLVGSTDDEAQEMFDWRCRSGSLRAAKKRESTEKLKLENKTRTSSKNKGELCQSRAGGIKLNIPGELRREQKGCQMNERPGQRNCQQVA